MTFGPDESLIKSMVKPSATLDSKLSADQKTKLLGGDLGMYLNVAAVQTKYSGEHSIRQSPC